MYIIYDIVMYNPFMMMFFFILFRPLSSLSPNSFENELQIIKNMLRSGYEGQIQVIKRHSELESFHINTPASTCNASKPLLEAKPNCWKLVSAQQSARSQRERRNGKMTKE